MQRLKILSLFLSLLLSVVSFNACSGSNTPTRDDTSQEVTGNWYFDLKTSQSYATTKESKYLLKSVVGEEMIFDNHGNFSSHGKKVGKIKNISPQRYIITTIHGSKMEAHYQKPYLRVIQKRQGHNFVLYFSQKNSAKNSHPITEYIHLNRVYRQPKKVYDNGYLFYLFSDNGRVYNYVSTQKDATKAEIIEKGTALKYHYIGNKIYIRSAMFTVTVEAKNRKELHTSQDDTFFLQ